MSIVANPASFMTEEQDRSAYSTGMAMLAEQGTANTTLESREITELDTNSEGQPDFVAKQPSGDAEKRRGQRYKCEGSVEIREKGCEVPTFATFTDISLHGCYLEVMSTYPVGAPLYMKLEAKGFRIWANGSVRVSYPCLGMGIAFTEISDDNQECLKELLCTISRPSVILESGSGSAISAGDARESVPFISEPSAAVRAIVAFFEGRPMLMRDEFIQILRRSQEDFVVLDATTSQIEQPAGLSTDIESSRP